MLKLIDLITDRTMEDQEYALANRNNPTPNKGAYCPDPDFNRVNSALRELHAVLQGFGYIGFLVEAKTDWTHEDMLTRQDFERYLSDIRAVVSSFYVKSTSPELPVSMYALDYQGANAIEQILLDINDLIALLKQSFRRCGTFAAGEDFTLTQIGGA